MYADIIVDISHEKVDRPFQYRVPPSLEESIDIGSRVIVPFGKGNKNIMGYCIGFSDKPEYDPIKIKDILEVNEIIGTSEVYSIKLANFLRCRYGTTMIQALKTVLPVKATIKSIVKKTIIANIDKAKLDEYYEQIKNKKNQLARIRLVELLLEKDEISYSEITNNHKIAPTTIKSLERDGIIKILSEVQYRNPVNIEKSIDKALFLSEKQQNIIDEIAKDRENGQCGKYYIHGITGSGKTAVYIELIEEVIKNNQQAIVLIPEISLTYQTLNRFYARFGDKVSVMNSNLSAGERYDQIRRAREKEISIIIGPRSALFVPFSDIGLIIIDEEHEGSYKSDLSPKYHAIEVAEEIARLHKASLVLGSATPSIDSYYKVEKGEYRLFELKERLTGGVLPEVSVVDLREELKNGNRSIFSLELQDKIKDALNANEQIILFLNRRGYTGFISCRSCGNVIKCKHCSVSLSEHRDGRLYCHYCGYSEIKPKTCPECNSKYISGMNVGTEQIEERVLQMFPKARCLRMDADTTKTKGSYEKILGAFDRKEADILIGTQMIVKGHDFPNVTLVGIIAADLSLGFADYKSSEKTFQLLTQAAGRAGRGTKPGNVVIQTYKPEHFCIQCAKNHDFSSFYKGEMEYREFMNYPPISHMLAIQLFSRDEKSIDLCAKDLVDYMQMIVKEKDGVLILGPTKAIIYKIKDVYRYVIYIKANSYNKLLYFRELLEKRKIDKGFVKETMQFDFNPANMF